ncbi:hypothetical protein ABFS82_06G202900 [Erythranthe guttata]|nr:PREDICTED: uncharacterized protein LOC105955446 [Erythranthe guttata]|eukprot:XP_012834623.1 PREDICTED: uncharacterized protein LOC105955446 [Erythranthe guttata]
MSSSATVFVANSSSLSSVTHVINSSTTPRTTTNVFHHHKQQQPPHTSLFLRPQYAFTFSLRVTNENSRTEASPSDDVATSSDADAIVDGMNFGELCNDFECISSPSVESTARQLVRDILQLRQGNRALGTFAVSVKYKDPVRSFTGRDKYKRQLWATDALDNLSVSVQQMTMLSTSVLNIKWTLKGKPKSPISIIGGDLILKVNSKFTLNQISGQVIEHEEIWDLSASSPITQAYFWTSKRIFATVESGKDISDFIKDLSNRATKQNKNIEIYPDPTGDPTKFFQRDDSFQRDVYQIALFLAVVYFVVQFLKATL